MNTQLLTALTTGLFTLVAGGLTVWLSTRSARRQNADTLSAQTQQARWREEGLLAGERWRHYEWLAAQNEAKDRRIDDLLEKVRQLEARLAHQGSPEGRTDSNG